MVWEWDEKLNQWVEWIAANSTGTENNLLSTLSIFPQRFLRWRRHRKQGLVDIEHVHVFELYYLLVFGLVRLLCTAAQNVIVHKVLWVIVSPMALMWQLTDSWEWRTLLLASYMHGLYVSPSKLPCSVCIPAHQSCHAQCVCQSIKAV